MQRRALGSSAFEVSTIGIGTWATGGWMWGGQDDDASVQAIHAAADHGVNWIDTAPIYGSGHSEAVVVLPAPHPAAGRPRADADGRNLESRRAEWSSLHAEIVTVLGACSEQLAETAYPG